MPIDMIIYQENRSILLAVRSIYWFIAILENRGIPAHIIYQLRAALHEVKMAAVLLPYYDQLNFACECEIDNYHEAERPPQDEIPEHRWVFARQKKETYAVIDAAISLLQESLKAVLPLQCDLSGFQLALDGLNEWLEKNSREDLLLKDLSKAIDSLGLDDKSNDIEWGTTQESEANDA